MNAWLVRFGLQFAFSEKGVKWLLYLVAGVAFFFLLIIMTPIIMILKVPLGDTQDYQLYKDTADRIRQYSGLPVDWQEMMAIDAVRFNQDFSKVDPEQLYRDHYYFFIVEETVESTGTCSDGETTYECTTTSTEYRLRPLDDVLWFLKNQGILSDDDTVRVRQYLDIDLNFLLYQGGGGGILHPDWRPLIREFLWPLDNIYTVTSLFGYRSDPFTGESSLHSGLDIGAPIGTPVRAVKAGTVIYASDMGTAGNTVIIDHGGGMETRYYHLNTINVRVNDGVRQGEIIGEVGTTGRSTGPHLHLEVRIGKKVVDPLRYYQ